MDKISKWVEAAKKIAKETKKIFGNLTASQLNWKSEKNQWSIAQCFEHIMITNKAYISCMKKLIEGKSEDALWKSFPAVTNFFGKALVKSLHPVSIRKLDAPQLFWPSTASFDKNIITDFLHHQKDLIALIEQCEYIDREKAIFCSPVARFVTLTLEDGISMLLYHEQRHFVQAQNMLARETIHIQEVTINNLAKPLDSDLKLQA